MSSKKDKTHNFNLNSSDSKLLEFLNKHKLIIILVFIFILAFGVRGHLLKYDYMYEYDPYWHLRATSYVLEGDLPDNDPLGFYEQGGSNYENRPKFLWYFTAAMYILFTLGAEYKKWVLMDFARWLPAIFGAFISVAMYFFGKELYGRKAGYVMALVSATIPAFVYRTMAGFFEEDALGFLWMILGFLFFIKALKHVHANKKHLTFGVISAVFFFLMAITWAMFLMIPLVMIAYFIGNLIYMAIKNASNYEMASFAKIFLVVFILFVSLSSLAIGSSWINRTSEYVSEYIPLSSENIDRINKKANTETDVVGASVGEENTGKQFFLVKYNFLVWIPFLLVILMPINLLVSKKKDYLSLLIFFWVLITLFMAWSKLKFTYVLGLPIAAASGYLFYIFNRWIEKSKRLSNKRFFAIFMAIILLSSIAAGTHFISTKTPPITQEDNWRETLFWINENTPEDSKIFNWWDYGHWITYFAERKASTDNTNSYVEADSEFAQFIISDDLNKTKNLLKKYDPDYLVADNSYFKRFNSFASYAHMTTDYSDSKITKYFGATLSCNKAFSRSDPSKYAYRCGQLTLKKQGYDSLPTEWRNKPNEVINGQPVFIYKDKYSNDIFIANSAINNSYFAKLWLGSEDMDNFGEMVYNNNGVRVYKINKDFYK